MIMSRWDDDFKNHQIHNNLQSANNLLKEIQNFDDQDPEIFEEINRLNQIIRYVPIVLSKVDPVMTPLTIINELDQIVINITGELNNYKNTKDRTQLINANGRAENLLIKISNLIIPSDYADIKGIREATSSLRRSVGQYIRNIKNEQNNFKKGIEGLEGKINELSTTIDNQKTRLDEAITQFQQQFSQAEEQRRGQFTQSQEKWTQEFTMAVDKRKAEFTQEQEALKQAQGEFLNEINNKKNMLENELKTKNEQFVNELSAKIESYIKKFEGYKKRAEELVHVIADTGMVGGYQEFANKERRAALLWKIVAVLSFIGLIGFAIVAFYIVLQEKFDWSLVAGRVFVASTFGVLGAYAARLADRHEEKEKINRRMELELASIDPYLVGLPEEVLHKLKASLAERLFARKEPIKAKKKEEISGSSYDLIKQLVETLRDLVKNSEPG